MAEKLSSKLSDIEQDLNDFHKKLAQSDLLMDKYTPLSSELIQIKEKLRTIINEKSAKITKTKGSQTK